MLTMQRAGGLAAPTTLLAARRKVAPARTGVTPRAYAVPSRGARLRVTAAAGAAVVCAAGDDNAAQAQAWIDAWRAKASKGGAAAAKAPAAKALPNAAEAQAWIAAWRAKQSSAGGASLLQWAHFAAAMAAFLAADRALMAFAASNGAPRRR